MATGTGRVERSGIGTDNKQQPGKTKLPGKIETTTKKVFDPTNMEQVSSGSDSEAQVKKRKIQVTHNAELVGQVTEVAFLRLQLVLLKHDKVTSIGESTQTDYYLDPVNPSKMGKKDSPESKNEMLIQLFNDGTGFMSLWGNECVLSNPSTMLKGYEENGFYSSKVVAYSNSSFSYEEIYDLNLKSEVTYINKFDGAKVGAIEKSAKYTIEIKMMTSVEEGEEDTDEAENMETDLNQFLMEDLGVEGFQKENFQIRPLEQ